MLCAKWNLRKFGRCGFLRGLWHKARTILPPPHPLREPPVLAARLLQFNSGDMPLDNAPLIAYTSIYDRGNQPDGTGMHRVSRPHAEPDGHGDLRRRAVAGWLAH